MMTMIDNIEVTPNDWIPESDSIIKVLGVGGGGCNAVNYMYNQKIEGCTFVVCNTDSQALNKCDVPIKIQLGEGLGAGTNPTEGRNAALNSQEEIAQKVLDNRTEMLFITAGMGGGTGTGAAPVIAAMARKKGILTVGVVTIPFRSQGPETMIKAIDGINELEKNVDSLIIINNEKLYKEYGDLLIRDAFPKADEVLATAVRGITEIIKKKGFINVDFKDVKAMMTGSGMALMGCGTGSGKNRLQDAVKMAMDSPLLNDFDIKTAKNVLINITSGSNKDGLMMKQLDEIDKMSHDYRGDPASCLLEVLDAEQNNAFRDHYLELPFDLSRVMFITTANSVDTIPGPLLDRMEIIEVPSYTEEEKLQICKRHLLPKQIEAHGLQPKSVKMTDKVLRQLIEGYTREAGVRTLERTVAKVVRKSAVTMLDEGVDTVNVTPEVLRKYLGAARYTREMPEKEARVGVVNGLAYTTVGGEMLEVECLTMPGKGSLHLTGKLGEVMKESAEAAFTWVRAHSAMLGLQDDFYNAIHAAGYTDVERGERGSTEEHLTVTQFKVQQEAARLEVLEAQTEKKEQQLQRIEQKTRSKKSQATTFDEIDSMGRKTFTGKIEFTPHEAEQLKNLAKKAISASAAITDLKKKLEAARQDTRIWKDRYESLQAQTKDFMPALKKAPEAVKAFLSRILHMEKKAPEQEKQQRTNILVK